MKLLKMQILSIFGFIICLATFVSGATFKVTSQIFMDVAIDSKPIGRIIFGLFGEEAPRTVKNFRTICIKGINGQSYAGSNFHRVIDRFMIQGGDIVSGDGSGSISIYGKIFDDENLSINHTGPGFLAMANRGPNTNGCQFYVTTMAAPWLNGLHTIFGKVVTGQGITHIIEKTKTDTDDYPVKPIQILDCGNVPISSAYTVSDNPYDLWAWVKASTVPLGMSFSILGVFHYIIRRLNVYIK